MGQAWVPLHVMAAMGEDDLDLCRYRGAAEHILHGASCPYRFVALSLFSPSRLLAALAVLCMPHLTAHYSN